MDSILKGLAISMLLVFSVGPIVFTIIKHSVNEGRAGGFSFIAGVWLSDFMIVILSNAFSALVADLLNFKKEIGVAGSAFLIGMGVYYIFFKKITMRSADEPVIRRSAATHARLAASGFLINTLNPTVFAFWLTMATTLSVSNTIKERIIIFTTCILVNLGADIAKVTLAGKLSKKLTHRNLVLINRISGSLLLIFGLTLIAGILFSVTKK